MIPEPTRRPSPSSLRLLLPFVRPYRWHVAGASLSLLVAAGLVLGIGQGLRHLIDRGFGPHSPPRSTWAGSGWSP